MKHKYINCLLLIFMCTIVFSQKNSLLFKTLNDQNISKKRNVKYIEINLEQFKKNELNILIDGKIKTFIIENVFGGIPYKSWCGKTLNSLETCAFVINNKLISGNISTYEGTYHINPSKRNGLHEIFKVDFENYGKCGNEEKSSHRYRDEASPVDTVGKVEKGRLLNGEECFVRVIVAYTDSAQAYTQTNFNIGMLQHVSNAVLQANVGYSAGNSEIRIELAHLYNTDDVETINICDDIDDLQSSSDQKFNEIHAKRNFYDADMCCLITDHVYTSAQSGCNSGPLCGIAFDFDFTDDSNMFQISSAACIPGQTFSHEFGHTQGCRHDNDNTGTPFDYARGFVSTGNFRTILAVNSNPEPRLNLFSNPDVIEPISGLNAGTATRDNARGLDAGDFNVAHHRVTPDSYSTGLTLDVDETLNMVATNSLYSSNIVPIGSAIELKSQGFIVLEPGFHSMEGSTGRVHIINQCNASYSIKADPIKNVKNK